MNVLLQVCIVGADKGISKVPGILCKDVICDSESEGTQILDEKYSSSAGIALTENVNLPEP